MNTEQLEIASRINSLKGIIHNIDSHQKYSLLDYFLKQHQNYIDYFEDSHSLSFAIQKTQHSKIITKIFLDNGYNPNKEPAIINAIKMQKFKSTKAILKYGFNINCEFNQHNFLEETFNLINTQKSNTTLRKINAILSLIDVFNLDIKTINSSKNAIAEAEKNIQTMYESHPALTSDILENFQIFKNKLNLIEKKLNLDINILEKSTHTKKTVIKI